MKFLQYVHLQLLRVQIPKAQKDSDVISVVLPLQDLGAKKVAHKKLVKLI